MVKGWDGGGVLAREAEVAEHPEKASTRAEERQRGRGQSRYGDWVHDEARREHSGAQSATRWADASPETRAAWCQAISEARNRPEVVEASRKRAKKQKLEDPEGWQRFHDARERQADAKSASILEQALKEALPYEPVKKKRIKGKYYWRLDGQLARWDGSSKLTPLRFQPEAKHNGEASSSSDPLPSEQPDAPME